MAMSDRIADLLTRIRNAQLAGHELIHVPTSKMIDGILLILKKEGFIGSIVSYKDGVKRFVKVELKYYQGYPVIRHIKRVSKPGRRIYTSWSNIRPTLNSIGISILSTPKGVISDKEAKMLHVGGELICTVW